MEVLVELVNSLIKYAGAEACTYLAYHLSFDEAVNDMRKKLEALIFRKEDIERSTGSEDCWDKEVKHEVQGWLKRVEEINDEVKAFEEKLQRVKWPSRGTLGKAAVKKIEVITSLQEEGHFPDGLMIAKPPAAGIVLPTENVVGQTSSRKMIWDYLMGNEISKVGVCGTGGVGKTTIMKQINNELLKINKFDKVIWVTVLYPLNVINIQDNIAHAMGKSLFKNEQKLVRAAALRSIMENERYVLILDNVWEKFSLEDVGIPEPTMQNGCKVVITSRLDDVCKHLGCSIVKMQLLSDEESLDLFLDQVGRDILNIPNFEGILWSIVKKCAGLPLAIVVIAATMRGVDDIKEWRNVLVELQEYVKTVSSADDEIFQQLRLSYDRLRSLQLQECFLFCSLFPKDSKISIEELIEKWIDEGLISGLGSRQAKYDRGHAFFNTLVRSCLLEKTNECFTMHDVLRDMAIKIIGPEVGYMVKAGMRLTEVPEEKEWVKDLKKVALMDISSIPEGLSPKCPTLSTLILRGNQQLDEIPESLFKEMCGLKVLDLSETRIDSLPESTSNLENLTALRLRGCASLKSVPPLANLKRLKKLDMFESGIKLIPRGMEMLTHLEYLDFDETNLTHMEYFDIDERNKEVIRTEILSKLTRLQYLYLGVRLGDRHSTLKIRGEQVATLSKLEYLKARFDDLSNFNDFVRSKGFQNLSFYKVVVCEEGCNQYSKDPGDRRVDLIKANVGEEGFVIPNNLQGLAIRLCRNLRSLNKTNLLEKGIELSYCIIENCDDVECVFDFVSSSSPVCPVLAKLEVLRLQGLPKLFQLVRAAGLPTFPPIFSNLKKLIVKGCWGITKLFSVELLQSLRYLVEVEVSMCLIMEEIIASGDSTQVTAADASTEFHFPKLKRLSLELLPRLNNICSVGMKMVCESIEEIQIIECPLLKRIPIHLPLLDNGEPSVPPHLRKIRIDRSSEKWWESLEWDNPKAKHVLQRFVEWTGGRTRTKSETEGELDV